jgi:hypothetical protein
MRAWPSQPKGSLARRLSRTSRPRPRCSPPRRCCSLGGGAIACHWSHCMPLEPSPLAGQTGCAERVSAWRRGGAVRGDAAQGGLSAEQNRAARAARGGAARPPGTQHLSQSRLTQPCLFCIPPEEYRNEGGSARAVRQRGSPPTAGCDAAARRGAQVAALGQERNLLFEGAQVGWPSFDLCLTFV